MAILYYTAQLQCTVTYCNVLQCTVILARLADHTTTLILTRLADHMTALIVTRLANHMTTLIVPRLQPYHDANRTPVVKCRDVTQSDTKSFRAAGSSISSSLSLLEKCVPQTLETKIPAKVEIWPVGTFWPAISRQIICIWEHSYKYYGRNNVGRTFNR